MSTGFPANVDGNVENISIFHGKKHKETRIICWKNAKAYVDIYLYTYTHTHTHTPTRRLIFQAFSPGKEQKIRD